MILSTGSTSILLNGVAGPSIWDARGLRQGDPLSMMMFIIAMDALILLVSKADAMGLLSSFPSDINKQRLAIYVDDVILFLRASTADV